MTGQPFWTSKTFWTMVLGLLVYIANEQFGILVPEAVVVGIMAFLGIIFRWVADNKLTIIDKR